jgi:hypothetical protein
VHNCTRDEGGPFEFGNQVLISSHRKLLRLNVVVVSVAETRRDDDSGRQGRERRVAPSSKREALKIIAAIKKDEKDREKEAQRIELGLPAEPPPPDAGEEDEDQDNEEQPDDSEDEDQDDEQDQDQDDEQDQDEAEVSAEKRKEELAVIEWRSAIKSHDPDWVGDCVFDDDWEPDEVVALVGVLLARLKNKDIQPEPAVLASLEELVKSLEMKPAQ